MNNCTIVCTIELIKMQAFVFFPSAGWTHLPSPHRFPSFSSPNFEIIIIIIIIFFIFFFNSSIYSGIWLTFSSTKLRVHNKRLVVRSKRVFWIPTLQSFHWIGRRLRVKEKEPCLRWCHFILKFVPFLSKRRVNWTILM